MIIAPSPKKGPSTIWWEGAQGGGKGGGLAGGGGRVEGKVKGQLSLGAVVTSVVRQIMRKTPAVQSGRTLHWVGAQASPPPSLVGGYSCHEV